MATTITNKRTLFDVVSESGTLKLQGTATMTTDSWVKDFNASITNDNNHVGHANYSEDGENLQRNIYCPIAIHEEVSTLLDSAVADIKTEFTV